MSTLWRLLALAWLGGMASPALADDPATIEDMSADGACASLSASLEDESGDVGITEPRPLKSASSKTSD